MNGGATGKGRQNRWGEKGGKGGHARRFNLHEGPFVGHIKPITVTEF